MTHIGIGGNKYANEKVRGLKIRNVKFTNRSVLKYNLLLSVDIFPNKTV